MRELVAGGMEHGPRSWAAATRALALLVALAGPFASGSAPALETADVRLEIDVAADLRPISPYVYGVNRPLEGVWSRCTLTRLGGNRWTAYNWETNASNAGSDWFHQNDGFLSTSDVPGEAVRPTLAAARARGAAALVTIPMAGYVAADKDGGGDVAQTPSYLATRFHPTLPAKGAPFSLVPDPDDGVVYQDEFVAWVNARFPGAEDPAHPVFYSLDNEPDLWASTHARIHPDPATYDELVTKTVATATAIKEVSPGALVFGPVSYGWYGYLTLQDAPDGAGRDFLEVWLAAIEAASQAYGARLVDVLDVHWYPEAQGDGVRITGPDTTPAVVAARLQAPRSLWDPTYSEDSWIAQWSTGGPIALLSRLRARIDAHAPGTRLAITEYNYGGGAHISGGIAQADVLGIFGREGVFAAAEWPLAADESFIAAAFRMYLDYDGAGGTFGDLSVRATTDDAAATSVYASLDSGDPSRLVVVAINKTGNPLDVDLELAHAGPLASARAFRLTGGAAAPVDAGPLVPAAPTRLRDTLPAWSVSTLVLTVPEPHALAEALAALLVTAGLAGRSTARSPRD